MDKEKEVTIQSIKIIMGKKEVELSIEEAKKLKKALEEIFGEKVITKTEHIHHHDYYRWFQPYYGYTYESPKKYDYGIVYCSTAKGSTGGQSNMQNLCLTIN